MNAVFRTVAFVLAVALLSAPAAAALSSCWIRANEARHGCPAGCPMMGMTAAHHGYDGLEAAPGGKSCCNISSGQATPTTQLQLPSADKGTAVVAVPQSSFAFAAALVSPRTGTRGSPPSVVPMASPQAVLCTFLI